LTRNIITGDGASGGVSSGDFRERGTPPRLGEVLVAWRASSSSRGSRFCRPPAAAPPAPKGVQSVRPNQPSGGSWSVPSSRASRKEDAFLPTRLHDQLRAAAAGREGVGRLLGTCVLASL